MTGLVLPICRSILLLVLEFFSATPLLKFVQSRFHPGREPASNHFLFFFSSCRAAKHIGFLCCRCAQQFHLHLRSHLFPASLARFALKPPLSFLRTVPSEYCALLFRKAARLDFTPLDAPEIASLFRSGRHNPFFLSQLFVTTASLNPSIPKWLYCATAARID